LYAQEHSGAVHDAAAQAADMMHRAFGQVARTVEEPTPAPEPQPDPEPDPPTEPEPEPA
jgi:hypothetical protein